MTDLEFFWDPICPWAWITSRWVVNVQREMALEVHWRFIALRFVNEGRNYAEEFPAGYERRHHRGLRLLRVAAAVRAEAGESAVLPLYTALGRTIHHRREAELLDRPKAVAGILAELGHPPELAEAASTSDHDELIRVETAEALDRCGGFVGTPVLSFSPPDGPSFFGPVISRAPVGAEALDLWNAVTTLARNPEFSELKRSTRARPRFDD